MVAKINVEWQENDITGRESLILMKRRGKLTIQEIEEFLQRYPHGELQGNWCLIIRANEETCVTSWYEEPGCDAVELYQLG